MLTSAAQMAAYLYPEEEDPEGAFSWWLSPCGGTNLVPDEIKKIFGILSEVTNGISSFKTPKSLKKGSGKKGDDGNPHDQSTPRSTNNNNNNNNNNSGSKKKKKCNFQGTKTDRKGEYKNTLRMVSCNKKDESETLEYVVTSLKYDAQAKALPVKASCSKDYPQACHHYKSAISVNKAWETLPCRPVAATTSRDRKNGKADSPQATGVWYKEHKGTGWRDRTKIQGPMGRCQADEYPPYYLLDKTDTAWINSGVDSTGQLVRLIPGKQNGGAGNMWKGVCFGPPLEKLSDGEFSNKFQAAANKHTVNNIRAETVYASMTVSHKPEFTIVDWDSNLSKDGGLEKNDCWPKQLAALDPGFALLSYDPWYRNNPSPYDYTKPYKKGSNGS